MPIPYLDLINYAETSCRDCPPPTSRGDDIGMNEATLEPYEIYAVKYAWRVATRNDHLIFKDPHDDPVTPMDYFVWAIVGKHKTFVLIRIRP